MTTSEPYSPSPREPALSKAEGERGPGGEVSTRPKLGRPRSAKVGAAIFDATLELLAEAGLEGVNIEAVAARAGVGKATIYRRWPSRNEMVAAAFRSITSDTTIPDTGNFRDDLITVLQGFQRTTMRSISAEMAPRLIAFSLTSPELRDIFLANMFAPRSSAIRTILERGQQRGEIRADLDLDLAIRLICGPIFLTLHLGEKFTDPEMPVRVLDTLLEGLRAPAT